MKKIFFNTLLIGLAILLFSCEKVDLNIAILNNAYTSLRISNLDLNNVETDFTVPNNFGNVAISWESSDESHASIKEGKLESTVKVSRPIGETDAPVTLKASLSIVSSLKASKVLDKEKAFNLVVKNLVLEEDLVKINISGIWSNFKEKTLDSQVHYKIESVVISSISNSGFFVQDNSGSSIFVLGSNHGHKVGENGLITGYVDILEDLPILRLLATSEVKASSFVSTSESRKPTFTDKTLKGLSTIDKLYSGEDKISLFSQELESLKVTDSSYRGFELTDVSLISLNSTLANWLDQDDTNNLYLIDSEINPKYIVRIDPSSTNYSSLKNLANVQTRKGSFSGWTYQLSSSPSLATYPDLPVWNVLVDKYTVSLSDSDKLMLDQSSLTVGLLFSESAVVTVPTQGANQTEIIWASSNTEVISVNNDKLTITVVPGQINTVTLTATIKIASNQVTKEFNINVSSKIDSNLGAISSLGEGTQVTITADILSYDGVNKFHISDSTGRTSLEDVSNILNFSQYVGKSVQFDAIIDENHNLKSITNPQIKGTISLDHLSQQEEESLTTHYAKINTNNSGLLIELKNLEVLSITDVDNLSYLSLKDNQVNTTFTLVYNKVNQSFLSPKTRTSLKDIYRGSLVDIITIIDYVEGEPILVLGNLCSLTDSTTLNQKAQVILNMILDSLPNKEGSYYSSEQFYLPTIIGYGADIRWSYTTEHEGNYLVVLPYLGQVNIPSQVGTQQIKLSLEVTASETIPSTVVGEEPEINISNPVKVNIVITVEKLAEEVPEEVEE